MDKFQKIKDSMESFQKQMTEECSKILQENFEEIFEKYPELNSFSWTQYTPYFADGDECIFGCNGLYEINGLDSYDYKNDAEKNVEVYKELENLIDSIPTDILKNIYGDHCKVVITRDNFKVEEYEHD